MDNYYLSQEEAERLLKIMDEFNNMYHIDKTKGEKMKTFKIVDYKTYDNKVVITTFEDGTKEKAVCCGDDKFDFERGIEVCILKHILGKDNYNTMLKTAMKQISDIDEANEKKKKEEKIAARKKEKHLEKKRKTIEARRKRRIFEMKEAYLGAITEYTAALSTTIDTMYEKGCNCDNDKWDEIYK